MEQVSEAEPNSFQPQVAHPIVAPLLLTPRACRVDHTVSRQQVLALPIQFQDGPILEPAAIDAGHEIISPVEDADLGLGQINAPLDEPDEGCDIDLVPKQAKQRKVRYALSNSFGFGGTNASLIFGPV